MIKTALQNKGYDVPNNETIDICTDIFIPILQDCASKQKKSSNQTCNGKSNKLQNQQTEPELMIYVYKYSFDGYGIKKFISLNPKNSIPAYCIEDALTFYNCIKTKRGAKRK